jgi:hypothetical protein
LQTSVLFPELWREQAQTETTGERKKRQRPGIRKFLTYVWKTKQACGFPVHADFKEEESQLPL